MKNKRAILFLIPLFCFMAMVADDFKLIKTIPADIRFFNSDHLKNIYIVNKDNELIKFDKDGVEKFQFSQKRHGKLKAMDATNPLKLLLLYPDFSTILALDNTLSQIGLFDFRNKGIRSIPAFCLSFDNNIWIYDIENFKLKKFNESLELIQESDDLSSLLGYSVHPVYMIERDNWLYVNDPSKGILVFDIYGSYYKTIPVTGLTHFQIRDDQLIYYKKGEITFYHLKTFDEKNIILPFITPSSQVRTEGKRLFITKDEGLLIYEKVQDQ